MGKGGQGWARVGTGGHGWARVGTGGHGWARVGTGGLDMLKEWPITVRISNLPKLSHLMQI